MAKKRKEPKNNIFKPDMEALIHLYSDYYNNDENDNYKLYDIKEVYYPYYKSKIEYSYYKISDIHPIESILLKIIDKLEKLKNRDVLKDIKDVTQLDNEIQASILADLKLRGYISNEIKLTQNGKEVLEKEKEKIKESETDFIFTDGVFGNVVKLDENCFVRKTPSKNDNPKYIELKPSGDFGRITDYALDNFWGKDSKITLRQTLIEALNEEIDESEEIVSLNCIESCNKMFKRYLCLFYKNAGEDEKYLVINEEYELDMAATKLFKKLLESSMFNKEHVVKTGGYTENCEKYEELTPEKIKEQTETPDLTDGKTIETQDHKKYFIHILKSAKEAVYIQSPWIRKKILDCYIDYIKETLKRNVTVYIKYGMKPRNRNDKVGIDEDAKKVLDDLSKEYNDKLKIIKDDDHSKILICDEDYMIMGSFNWLSFGGEFNNTGEIRGETSNVNKNKKSILEQIKKFKK